MKLLESYFQRAKDYPEIVKKGKKHVAEALLFGAIATPVCAYLGSYIGQGAGWLGGNIIDFIPLVKDVAPWLAERSGLITDIRTVTNFNENFYQTSGAISGLGAGAWSGFKLMCKLYG